MMGLAASVAPRAEFRNAAAAHTQIIVGIAGKYRYEKTSFNVTVCKLRLWMMSINWA